MWLYGRLLRGKMYVDFFLVFEGCEGRGFELGENDIEDVGLE